MDGDQGQVNETSCDGGGLRLILRLTEFRGGLGFLRTWNGERCTVTKSRTIAMPATKATKRKVIFSFPAPQAREVRLVGDFSNWETNPIPMKKLKSGQWTASVSLETGHHEYRYLVDGKWIDDPNCSTRVPNSFGSHNCVCVVS
jgi:1,4-alpha-glucan branching enzyme